MAAATSTRRAAPTILNFNDYGNSGDTNSTLTLGWSNVGSGNYTLTGTNAYLVSGDECIGNLGTGNMTQSGGINTLNNLDLGQNQTTDGSFGIGTYTLSATNGPGRMTANANEYIGYAGSGIFTQLSGTNTLSGSSLYIGCNEVLSSGTGSINCSGTGLYSLSGGLLNTTSGNEYVGYSSLPTAGVSNANFNQSGGTNFIVGSLVIGDLTGSMGTYSLTTGSGTSLLKVTTGITVGLAGAGTLTQTGGTVTLTGTGANGALVIGGTAGGSGFYAMSGSTARLIAASETIAKPSAAGTLSQTGGSNVTNVLSINPGGYYSLNGGTLQVDVGGLASGGSFANTGTFDGNNLPGYLYSNSIVDLSHGTWLNLSAATFGGGPQTLLLVPSNGDYKFGTVNNAGITHVLGTTLTVTTTQGFGGAGSFQIPSSARVSSRPAQAARPASTSSMAWCFPVRAINLGKGR